MEALKSPRLDEIPALDRRRSSGLILSPDSPDDSRPSPLSGNSFILPAVTSASATSPPPGSPPPEVNIPEGDSFNLGAARAETLLGKQGETPSEPKAVLSPPPQESPSPFAPQETGDPPNGRNAQISLEIQPSQKSSKITENPLPLLKEEEEKQTQSLVDKLRAKAGIGHELYRGVLAELFATGFLVFGGCCVNAQYVLSRTRQNAWIGVCVGWGLALLFAVQMAYRVSGAHLNPAVSFFQLTQGKISPLRFILYVIAQNIGAFFGAMFAFFVYWDAIDQYDGGYRFVTGPKATAGIFGTFPAPHLSMLGGMFDQIVGTAVLCMLIACIVDRRNRIPPFLQPSLIGAVLVFIGMTLGMNAGYAINPARDFAPRLFSFIAGYGWRVFSYRDYKWFWIPIICPMVGAVIGAWLYEFFIGFHIPDDPDTSYIHRIVDDRNPDGSMREIHLVEQRPYSERPTEVIRTEIRTTEGGPNRGEQREVTSYRNL